MREKAKKIKIAVCVLAGAAAVAAGLLGFGAWHRSLPKFQDLTVELGTETVYLTDFTTEYANPDRVKFVTDPQTIDLSQVGTTELVLSQDDKQETVTLTVQDTTPPAAVFAEKRSARIDSVPAPEEFVSEISDESETRVYFAHDVMVPKDYGDLTVTVIVEDSWGNQTVGKSVLTYDWMQEACQLEYGESLTVEHILLDPVRDASLVSQADIDEINAGGVGRYVIFSSVGDRTASCVVTVADTTGPQLEVKDLQVRAGRRLTLDSFVKSVSDLSGVAEVRLMSEFDTRVYGKQTVVIEAEDTLGNITTREAILWVANDFAPPVISGTRTELTVEKNSSPDFLEGVTAQDRKDGACEVTCDTGSLDLSRGGTYYITYTSVDSSGNMATARRKVIVQHDAEDTAKLVESIAAQLSDDPEEIRDYVRSYIYYNHSWGGDDPVWSGFTTRGGNCYVHALCLKAIFDLKGIESQLIWVTTQSHYWLIVKIDGVWKHIDPTPSSLHGRYSLMNDQQRLSTLSGRKWDTSLWPACE